MKAPDYKDYTKPFDGNLVLFDSKSYAKAMKKYVNYLHTEIKVAHNFLENSGANIGDQGDQCLQILDVLVKNIDNK